MVSQIKVNEIIKQSGSSITIGESGDTITCSGTPTGFTSDNSVTMAKLSTSGTETDNVKQRVAKAWVNFKGSGTVAINDDLNVSSITDNGTGNYTVNLSTSLANGNGVMSAYSIMDGVVYGDATGGTNNMSNAGNFRMRTVLPNTNASFDPDEVHVIILGDS